MVELKVLFGLSDLNEPIMNPRSEEDFSICRADASPGQKYILKFTPPSEPSFISRGRYSSPGGISKSVPRRKSDIKNKTNRSLNFDIGKRTHRQSTNNSTNTTNLSRSAKMLKSLNIDINKITNNSAKKINKTLNFDKTPSPKRLSTNINNKSKRNMSNLTLDSPSVIKTLQYDSSSETSDASPMNLSNGSIDENQNKTPSSNNNNRKAKKSLSYSSPSSNGKSPDFSVLSPGLRTELREKIDNIVQVNNLTPKFINFKNKITENAAVSTPRNLFNNYSDDDDDDDDGDNKKMKGKNSSDEIVKDKKEVEFIEKEGEEDEESPETPKNTICVVPESMSAIKKSHRKERVTGRLLKLEKSNIEKSFKMNTDNDEKKEEKNISITPETKNIKNTFNHTIESIKKSHKKNRQNKNKSCSIDSDDDDLSETGSLFDYSAEKLNDNDVNDNKIDKIPQIIIEEHQSTNEEIINKIDTNKTTTTTSTTSSTGNSTTTPENKIDYLRRIMTDSIKKSHKKVKDLNKKSLFKPRTLEKGLDDENDNKIITIDNNNITDDDKNRSGTPENMNSSRLLLDKFNSVKKSHKKDKHRVAGFSQQRQINLSNTKGDDDSNSTQQIDEASTSKTTDNNNWQLNNLGTSLLDDNNEPKPLCTSPNKRKNPSSDDNLQISSSSGCWKIENELNNDEFKIFTPIKKKKPLKVISTTSSSSTIDDSKLLADENIEIGRCETPKLSQEIDDDNNNNFKTPIKSKKINTDDVNDNEEDNDEQIDDVNGRLTPENQALHPHITCLSSIKKSHKKDKWTKSTKRTSYLLKKFIDVKNIVDSPMKENKTKTWRTNIDNQSSSDSADKCDDENQSNNSNSPKASTSYSTILTDTNSPTKTPPNTLETKTYLRLLQTTSIKRSHKKMRDKKKQESIIFDPDLSDDGSIFDETDKKINDLDNNDCLPLEGDDDHTNINDLTEKITCSKRRCSSGNKSDDGSIFGSDSEQQITPRRRNVKMIKNDTT